MQGPGNIEIVKTRDGSQTLWVKDMDETYHSRHGALTESLYIFIEKGFRELAKNTSSLSILEVGFGTGLNVLLTMKEALEKKIFVEFHTIEAFPLSSEIYRQLEYGDNEEDRESLLKIHAAPWNRASDINEYFRLSKWETRWQDYPVTGGLFDLVYYDAFAPSRQSEMWALPLLEKMFRLMKPGGKIVTYCAQGAFKRNLKSLGLEVESLQGPPGKAEMIRASKL